jgi:hypothetical protein
LEEKDHLKKLSYPLMFCALSVSASADLLFDNGLYNTATGGGQSFGWNQTAATPFRFGLADDFTLSGPSILQKLTTYGYSTGNSTASNMALSMFVQIRADVAGAPGAVIAGDMTTALAFTQTNTGDLRGASAIRPIFRFEVDLPNWNLASGSYWVQYNCDNVDARPDTGALSANMFSPNKDGTGNSRQYDLLAGTDPTQPGFDQPFRLEGTVVPEPGTMIAIGAGLAALIARRRRVR